MPSEPTERRGYPGEKARQGEIILRKRWQRIVFVAGLAGMVVVAAVVSYLSGAS